MGFFKSGMNIAVNKLKQQMKRWDFMGKALNRDIVVIGGGIMGAAIAYYSSKAGLDITVLEKKELASGTSSRCDGNILAIDKDRSEEHTSELQSRGHIVWRLLPEKKNKQTKRCLSA